MDTCNENSRNSLTDSRPIRVAEKRRGRLARVVVVAGVATGLAAGSMSGVGTANASCLSDRRLFQHRRWQLHEQSAQLRIVAWAPTRQR